MIPLSASISRSLGSACSIASRTAACGELNSAVAWSPSTLINTSSGPSWGGFKCNSALCPFWVAIHVIFWLNSSAQAPSTNGVFTVSCVCTFRLSALDVWVCSVARAIVLGCGALTWVRDWVESCDSINGVTLLLPSKEFMISSVVSEVSYFKVAFAMSGASYPKGIFRVLMDCARLSSVTVSG